MYGGQQMGMPAGQMNPQQQQVYNQQQMAYQQQQQPGYQQPNQGYAAQPQAGAVATGMPGSADNGRWQATEAQRTYYDSLFVQADAAGMGKIAGRLAVAYFSKSQLSKEQLRQVPTTQFCLPICSNTSFLKHR